MHIVTGQITTTTQATRERDVDIITSEVNEFIRSSGVLPKSLSFTTAEVGGSLFGFATIEYDNQRR
jgi:hypothetical protein